MAVTTQAQYRGHILAMFKAVFQAEPRLLLPLLPGIIDYARTGADPREAVEMFLTWVWQHLVSGTFNGHRFKHILGDAGVPTAFLVDVTERTEP